MQSVAISGNQWHSEAIRGTPMQSVAISSTQWASTLMGITGSDCFEKMTRPLRKGGLVSCTTTWVRSSWSSSSSAPSTMVTMPLARRRPSSHRSASLSRASRRWLTRLPDEGRNPEAARGGSSDEPQTKLRRTSGATQAQSEALSGPRCNVRSCSSRLAKRVSSPIKGAAPASRVLPPPSS